MASAVIAMQWENYAGIQGESGIFRRRPLNFNSKQERLARLGAGDRLWLVARCPQDHQYYFVGVLTIDRATENAVGSPAEIEFGRYTVIAREQESSDLRISMPAEGILRALLFESGQAIRY